MQITNHGTWQIYTPHTPPKDAPASAVFSRRTGDGVDWYDYVGDKNFSPDSVKMTVVNGVVAAAVTDPTRLWPGNGVVLEVHNALTGDPQQTFGEKLYDASSQSFKDPPPRQSPMDDILKRLKDLEDRG